MRLVLHTALGTFTTRRSLRHIHIIPLSTRHPRQCKTHTHTHNNNNNTITADRPKTSEWTAVNDICTTGTSSTLGTNGVQTRAGGTECQGQKRQIRLAGGGRTWVQHLHGRFPSIFIFFWRPGPGRRDKQSACLVYRPWDEDILVRCCTLLGGEAEGVYHSLRG